MSKLYEVYAQRLIDNTYVYYYFHSEEKAMIKYNRLRNELTDTVKNVNIVLVNDRGQKTED